MKRPPPSVAAYDAHARELSQIYESLAFEDAHQPILDLLPAAPGRVLDVGGIRPRRGLVRVSRP